MGIWDLDLCNVSKPCLFLKATEVINSQISLKQVLSARKHPYLFMSQQANRKCKSPASTSVSKHPGARSVSLSQATFAMVQMGTVITPRGDTQLNVEVEENLAGVKCF